MTDVLRIGAELGEIAKDVASAEAKLKLALNVVNVCEVDSTYRIYLSEDQIPRAWYNLRADMPTKPGRMLLPNGVPAEVEHISPVFAEELCRQELDDDTAYVDIPEGVREMYKVYRPSPLWLNVVNVCEVDSTILETAVLPLN